MRELKGEKDLNLAKEVLCAFESKHYPNARSCGDIREGLYWDPEKRCYSADFGFLLRGFFEDIRIFEAQDDWMDLKDAKPVAWVTWDNILYIFCAV